jgi:hypothetical protein
MTKLRLKREKMTIIKEIRVLIVIISMKVDLDVPFQISSKISSNGVVTLLIEPFWRVFERRGLISKKVGVGNNI